jgi:hypothetical protein
MPGKTPVKVQPEIMGIFFLGELQFDYMDWGGGGCYASLLIVNVMWFDLDAVAVILRF